VRGPKSHFPGTSFHPATKLRLKPREHAEYGRPQNVLGLGIDLRRAGEGIHWRSEVLFVCLEIVEGEAVRFGITARFSSREPDKARGNLQGADVDGSE
jgi:hypothetical protein